MGYGTVTGKADRGFVDYGAPNGARARIVGPSGEAISLEPVLGEGVDSVAFAVNRYGTVAGEIFLWRPDGHESAKPFVWSDDAGVRFPFGNDDPSDPVSVGALNDHGQLAGVRSVTHGYVWDPEKGVLEFGTTAGIREVRALNNHGQAIGRDIFDKVFVWQRADGLRYLPPLKPNGEHKCIANDIDDRGWIVGVCQYVPTLWIPDEAGAYRAVNLATRTVPVDGSVDGHFDWSEAIRIGEDGRILVWTYIAEYPGYQDEPSISLLLAPIASP